MSKNVVGSMLVFKRLLSMILGDILIIRILRIVKFEGQEALVGGLGRC